MAQAGATDCCRRAMFDPVLASATCLCARKIAKHPRQPLVGVKRSAMRRCWHSRCVGRTPTS